MHYNPGIPFVQALYQMAAHFSSGYTAYGCPSTSQKPAKSFLSSMIWGNEASPSPYNLPDDMDTTLGMVLHGYSNSHTADEKTTESDKKSPSNDAQREDTLARMKDMPMEIVYEIFGYVQPADLLHLSWADRRLREILLNKRSQFIWKGSLNNVRGHPMCPSDMTEPQFVNLIYSETCQFCGKQGVIDVFWTCNVRSCSKCIKKEFYSAEHLHSLMPDELYIEKLDAVFPYIAVNEYQPKKPFRAYYYHPIATNMVAELKDVMASQGSDGQNAWLKSKKEDQSNRLKRASVCEHWYNHWVSRALPPNSQIPLFDLAVTTVLSTALIYLWKDRIFG